MPDTKTIEETYYTPNYLNAIRRIKAREAEGQLGYWGLINGGKVIDLSGITEEEKAALRPYVAEARELLALLLGGGSVV